MSVNESEEPVNQPQPKKQRQGFDYAALGTDKQIVVQECTDKIKSLLHLNAQAVFEIGQQLILVKGQLDHGQYEKWIQDEFGWKLTTAWNFRNVAQTFKSSDFEGLNILPSVLYLIATPSFSDKARQIILERARRGEHTSYKEARIIGDRYKDASNSEDETDEDFEQVENGDKQDQEQGIGTCDRPEKEPSSVDEASNSAEKEAHTETRSPSPEELPPDSTINNNGTSINPIDNPPPQTPTGTENPPEEGPPSVEKSDRVEQDEAKGKANQSPHSGENGTSAHVVENPEAIKVMRPVAPVEQQQQLTQTSPEVELNDSIKNDSIKVDQSDRTCLLTYDDLDTLTSDTDLPYINDKQVAVWIAVTPQITKVRLNVPTWPKPELEKFLVQLERIAKELKQELKNEH